MAETVVNKKAKKFVVCDSMSFLWKYKYSGREITVHLTDGKSFTGKLRWFDEYAFKIILSEGSITIPIHNIIQYECEEFQLEGEQPSSNKNVFKYVKNPSTDKEKEQLKKYKYNKELIHFYLKDGIEVRGRLQWFLDYAYTVRPEDSNHDVMITKRQILYYRKIEV